MKECGVDDDEQKEDCFHSLKHAVFRREHKNVCGAHVHEGHCTQENKAVCLTSREAMLHPEKHNSARRGDLKLQCN